MTLPADELDRLARAAGIHDAYWDINGNLRVTPGATKRRILSAMNLPAETDREAADSLRRMCEEDWHRLLPPVAVFRRGRAEPHALAVTVPDDLAFSSLEWSLTGESSAPLTGRVAVSDLPVAGVADVCGITASRRRFAIPAGLDLGYYTLTARLGGLSDSCRVVMAPEVAYVPPWMERGERRFGLSCQVYGLRGKDDWGIGDLGDLRAFGRAAAKAGAPLVGINPLHALFPVWPDACSPYFPSSRTFLNPLMIDIDAIPFASACPGLARLRSGTDFARALEAARQESLVDYPAVTDLKLKALTAIYADFLTLAPCQIDEFEAFCVEGGGALRRFAAFSALHETMGGLPWDTWPDPFRSPDTPEVAAYSFANAERLGFFAFLQWLAETQLAQAGRETGLYRDLAVGVSSEGADAWADPRGLMRGMSFGAPPDAFSAIGQDWGLPPPNPREMRASAYEGFIAMVRANMRHAVGLRLDHVMGLLRLFWIPQGFKALEGAYVSYPFDDLLGIVALESWRARCFVVGEDLGTVPDEIRARMAEERLLSYRVFYFEKWPNGLFKRPETYPPLALVTADTHDMPTVAGHWLGTDIDARAVAGVFGGADAIAAEREEREKERVTLLAALADRNLLPDPPPDPAVPPDPGSLARLTDAVHRFVARTPSALLMVDSGDLLGETTQANLPGTVDEHPNWRRRLPARVDKLASSPSVRERLAAITAERSPTPEA